MKKELAKTSETALCVEDMPEENQSQKEARKFDLQQDILGLITSEKQELPRFARLDGVVIGTLAGLKDSGEPLVDFPGNSECLPARTTMTLSKNEIGREVALMFEKGDPQKPIVMGLIQKLEEGRPGYPESICSEKQNPIEAEVDGERLTLTAKKEIVLRCGKASITLTSAGKVIIRGAYVLSRSSGVNRIKGGSVQIN